MGCGFAFALNHGFVKTVATPVAFLRSVGIPTDADVFARLRVEGPKLLKQDAIEQPNGARSIRGINNRDGVFLVSPRYSDT